MMPDLMPFVIWSLVVLGLAFLVIAGLWMQLDDLRGRLDSAEQLIYMQGDWLLNLTHDVHGPYNAQEANAIIDDWIAEATRKESE